MKNLRHSEKVHKILLLDFEHPFEVLFITQNKQNPAMNPVPSTYNLGNQIQTQTMETNILWTIQDPGLPVHWDLSWPQQGQSLTLRRAIRENPEHFSAHAHKHFRTFQNCLIRKFHRSICSQNSSGMPFRSQLKASSAISSQFLSDVSRTLTLGFQSSRVVLYHIAMRIRLPGKSCSQECACGWKD